MIERKYVYLDEMAALQADLVSSDVFAIIGTDSIFVPSQQRKYISVAACREWPDLDGEVIRMTPGEAARTELKRAFPDVRLQARKRDFFHLDMSPPQFFSGPKEGVMTYFDLVGAYHQLYSRLTLDIAWPRGNGELWLKPVAERLETWKTARNTVVGITRAKEISVAKNGRIQWQRMHNPYFNPHLWRHIQEMLHELAACAVRNKAVYVATDGYIFLDPFGAYRFMQVLDDLGLKYRMGQGDGEITGWGSYNIQDVKRTQRRANSHGRICNLIMPKERRTLQWWKTRAMSHFG